jgi:hypothetical protein
MELLKQMPQDMRPTASKWDELKFPKAAEWFAKNVGGTEIEVHTSLDKVTTNYLGKDKYTILLTYKVDYPSFTFAGFPMRLHPYFHRATKDNTTQDGLSLFISHTGNETIARKWLNTPKGSRVTVRGFISQGRLLLVQVRNPSNNPGPRKIEAACYVRIADKRRVPAAQKPAPVETSAPDLASAASITAVLNRMPKHLLPDPKAGWDKLTLPKVNEWLAGYARKKPFRGQLAYAGCSVSHVKGRRYATAVSFAPIRGTKFEFNKETISVGIERIHAAIDDRSGNSKLTKTYSLSQGEAERWRAKPKGTRYDVGGRIVSLTLRPFPYFRSLSENEKPSEYHCLLRILVATVSEHKEKPTAASKPKPKPQPTTKRATNKAASRVRFAKMYISSGLKKKAIPILEEVITKYPNTKAAAEARELLKGVEK